MLGFAKDESMAQIWLIRGTTRLKNDSNEAVEFGTIPLDPKDCDVTRWKNRVQ
jgi:hypothetical protein